MDSGIWAGEDLGSATKAAILIHGRGAEASGILGLSDHLNLAGFAIYAPQAPNHSWYPYSFMAPDKDNEPAFSQAIHQIDQVVKFIVGHGIQHENIHFIGFSQGACLALEYSAQNARKYGAVIAFTGGLIGRDINPDKYPGNFDNTPVFIGASKKDMHVPLSRINDSAKLLESIGADVRLMIFNDSNHTIRQEELDWVNQYLLK